MMKTKNPLFLFLLLILVAVWLVVEWAGLVLNITPSMPVGLYAKQGRVVHRGDTVSVCLKEPYKSIGVDNFYIGRGRECNGSEALIKKVLAVPNDDVVLRDNFIMVNGFVYDYPTSHFDSAGRPLASYPRGEYQYTDGYWLVGTGSVKSWDSRYWGPVKKEQIVSTLRPLLTW